MKHKTYILKNEAILAHFVVYIKPYLSEDNPLSITPKELKRTLDQNAHFHRLCGLLEKSDVKWADKRRSLEDWKGLLVSGHAIATKSDYEIVRGLENELISLRESTANMSKSRSSSLLEYTIAFCAEHGIV